MSRNQLHPAAHSGYPFTVVDQPVGSGLPYAMPKGKRHGMACHVSHYVSAPTIIE